MSDHTPLSLGFLQFMEAAPDAMVCIDKQGTMVLVNQQAEKMFGYRRLDMLGHSVEKLLPAGLREKHVRHRSEFMESPHVRPMGLGLDLKAVRQDGKEFPVEISLSPITTPEGTIVAASIRDLSARRADAVRFRSLLDATPDAIVIVDGTGRIVLVNRQAEVVFGYARGEMLDKEVEMLMPDRYRLGHLDHRTGFFSNPSPRPMGSGLELYAKRKDGAEFPVEISLGPMESEGETWVAAAIRDVSERKKQEDAVAKAQERERRLREMEERDSFRTKFINSAAHELFTPMMPILSTLALLKKEDIKPEKKNRAVTILADNFGRLSDLISDLLDASRFQSGTLKAEISSFDLAALVRRVAEAFEEAAMDRNLDLVVDAPRTAVIASDEKKLTQVLYNLVSNAIKYTPARGHVEMMMWAEGERYFVRVRDSGIGLSPDQQERIFQPFARLHPSSLPGSGLGLYISKGIIELLGGEISVYSDGIGEGATFEISLPMELQQ